jgi:phosphoribosyl 1,2-cyclic phosphodiesterase
VKDFLRMLIRCWGSRGSIPVSGKEYLAYGGDTTCLEIRTKNDHIIIVDAGTGIRRLGNRLMEEGRFVYDFIFTHAHWDHLMGFPFFKPLYRKGTRIRMQGCPFAGQYVKHLISRVMAPPNFPVQPGDLKAEIEYEPVCSGGFVIDTVMVFPIALSHPNQGSGYKFVEDGKTFVFLTDNELDFIHPGGLSFAGYREVSAGADLLIHDAEFTKREYEEYARGWGHSTFLHALTLASESRVKKLGLFHHNQDRTDGDVDRIVGHAREILREQGSGMECFAVGRDAEFLL